MRMHGTSRAAAGAATRYPMPYTARRSRSSLSSETPSYYWYTTGKAGMRSPRCQPAYPHDTLSYAARYSVSTWIVDRSVDARMNLAAGRSIFHAPSHTLHLAAASHVGTLARFRPCAAVTTHRNDRERNGIAHNP
jgi:hypothetical protein